MRRGSSSSIRIWLVGVALAAGIGLAALAALAPARAPARTGRTLVACVNQRTLSTYVFRRAPRRCVLHFSNKPFDGKDMASVGWIHWIRWGSAIARGHGTTGEVGGTTSIVLSQPRRCANGTRDYTHELIVILGHGSVSGPLAACRR